MFLFSQLVIVVGQLVFGIYYTLIKKRNDSNYY